MFQKLFCSLFYFALLVICAGDTVGETPHISATLQKCGDFKDYRVNPPNPEVIYVPANLSSRGEVEDKPLFFKLGTAPPDQVLDCLLNGTYIHRVPWSVGFFQTTPEFHGYYSTSGWARNYGNITTARLPFPLHFTSDGHFFAGQIYHRSNGGYCVKSISRAGELELRVCKVRCVRTPAFGLQKDSYCLPKCCGLDEVLLFWKEQCVKINETRGDTRWTPKLFAGADLSSQNLDEKLPQFYLRQFVESCNHLKTPSGIPFAGKWSSQRVEHPTNPSIRPERNNHIRLGYSSEDGKAYPLTLHVDSRSWKIEKDIQFCADGFFVNAPGKEERYTGNPDNFVIYYCDEDVEQTDFQVKETQSVTYVAVSIVACLFLVAIVVVYGALLDKQNIHGLNILSYSVAQLGGYLSLIVAHIMFLYPNPDVTGITRRGWFCYIVAILAHYFYIASYFWLTVLNWDLFLSFRQLKVVTRDPNDVRKFSWYSLFAWGLPLILIAAFIAVDEVYRDPTTLVPVPDYATSTCFVSPNFRGEFLYIPISIFIIFNLLLTILTMKIFYDARVENKTMFVSSAGGGSSNSSSYSVMLFLKLFIIMGGNEVIAFLTWYYNQKDDKPWYIITMECVVYLTPVLLFILLCVNKRVGNQLRDKYPLLEKIFKQGGSQSRRTTKTDDGYSMDERRRNS